MDEGAHVAADQFYRVILPAAEMLGTALIVISTPEDEDNWFSRITSLISDDGKPIFHSHMFRRICARHRQMNVRKMTECQCVVGANPVHKDVTKRGKYKKAFEAEGLEREDLQENYGVITKGKGKCFIESEIRRSIDTTAPRVHLDKIDQECNVRLVTMNIDPNCGGPCRTGVGFGYLNERSYDHVVSFSQVSFSK